MAIVKVSGGAEQMFEEDVVMSHKQRFTIKQLDAQIVQAQARVDELKAKKAEVLKLEG